MLGYLRSVMLGMTVLGLLATATAARAEWWEAETSHFVIVAESNKADAERFASRLERFDNALRFLQRLPIPGPEIGPTNKVRVYRFGDPFEIGELAAEGGGRAGINGFYVGRPGASVAFAPTKADDSMRFDRNLDQRQLIQRTALTPEGTLFHEYVHHFMLQRFNTTYPHWYVEGFAELYGTIQLLDGGVFKVGDVPQHRGPDLARFGDVKLTKLFDHSKRLSGQERYQSYSFGWLLSHYLNFNKERQGQLRDYLKALNTGEDSLTAATRVFGDLDTLQKELQKYKNGPFPGYEVIPANYVEPVVKMRRLTPGEEAVIEGHIRSERGVDRSGARSVVRSIGGKETLYPDNLAVQLAVAEAYSDAREFDKAEAVLKRALAIDPGSQKAHVLMGALISARADAQKEPALYAKARTWFADAVRLDPKDPRAAIGLYLTYYEAREPIPESALLTLEGVFDYSSHDDGYRLILARQLLDENRGKAARSVLAPLAFSAHKEEEANKIATIVEEIDAGKIEEARTTMAAIFAESKKKAED
ncbi:MAG: tetratricopeptide repeat protein [Sphingopyxis sp.]|nr:tetratricopeptide repeat protein [Sphingopyxis sp.]